MPAWSDTGPTSCRNGPRPGFLKLLLAQFNNFLVIILIVAAVISLLLGEVVDALAIMAIVTLNAVLGVVQESKAEQALAALKKMAAPNAQVLRDGAQATLPARELVPGDVVLLEAGNYVPADMRLVESVNLKVEEASLTGESVPVNKDARVVLGWRYPVGRPQELGVHEHAGHLWPRQGPGHIHRHAHADRLIAEMLQSYEDEPTPLQQKLDQLGKWLGIVSLAICGIIFLFGVIRDTQPAMVFQAGTAGLPGRARARHRRPVHDGCQPGHRGRARGPAGGGDHLPGAGHAAHGQPPRVDPQAAGRGNVGLRDGRSAPTRPAR